MTAHSYIQCTVSYITPQVCVIDFIANQIISNLQHTHTHTTQSWMLLLNPSLSDETQHNTTNTAERSSKEAS